MTTVDERTGWHHLAVDSWNEVDALRFEELPATRATVSDLDIEAVSRMMKRAPTAWNLRSFALTTLEDGVLVPTNAGIVVACPTPYTFIPSAHVRCACFRGELRSEIVDCAEIDTVLPTAPDLVRSFVQRNLPPAPEGTAPFPVQVIRELVVNAIVHADYSGQSTPIRVAMFGNRIEIENPGCLLPGVTAASMRTGVSRLHNPHIARIFREMSLMNDWGTGFGHVIGELQACGLPEPRVEELPGVVRVTVFLVPEPAPVRPLVYGPEDDGSPW